MQGFRAIARAGFRKPAGAANLGQPPELAWLSIGDLVVDESYQREISKVGAQNVEKIAAEFNWLNFAPVIVAPVPGSGGKYAVVDGQHRASAAFVIGIDRVPCSIVAADVTQQAAAFKAVNGNVTRAHAFSIFHAAVMAGDKRACAIQAACDAGGVRVARYPRAAERLAPGETLALTALSRALSAHGEAALIAALHCITRTAHNQAGMLRAQAIYALTRVHGDKPAADWPALRDVIARIDLPGLVRREGKHAGCLMALQREIDRCRRGVTPPTRAPRVPFVPSIPPPGQTMVEM